MNAKLMYMVAVWHLWIIIRPRRCLPPTVLSYKTLQWRRNDHNGVSNHQPRGCLLNRLYIQTQIKENIKAPRHWPLCAEFTGDRWIPRTKGQ